MKKYLEYFGIVFLFVFSFIYTEKISNIAKNRDPIMKQILEVKDSLKVESVNAFIDDKNITPGKIGCEIDTNKSYLNMKKVNKYSENMLKYKDIIPEISLNNTYDKYITSGNSDKRNVSFVVYIKDDVDKIKNIDTKLNLFIDSNLFNDGKIELGDNKYVYNGGENTHYNDVEIEWVNDIIESYYNKPSYCLNINKNDDNIIPCVRNRMHTISPNIIVNNSNIYFCKKNISNGSIIYFDENNIDKINIIKDYCLKKGFSIVYLDELLNEGICK